MTPLCCAALVGLLAASEPANLSTPPRPLKDNPVCPYPAEARAASLTGDVHFRAVVRPDGSVESVTIEQAPEEDLGLSESVRTTVSRWKFEPATFQGQPTLSTYRDVIPFEIFFPTDHARVFPVSSDQAYTALKRVFDRLGMRLRTRDMPGGVLITERTTLKKIQGPGPDLKTMLDGADAESLDVMAFVSREVEPAHVHIDARVQLRSGNGHVQRFSRGSVETWVLDALATELGKGGLAMPYSREGLARLQRDLGFPVPECAPTERAKLPAAIRTSLERPQYPPSALGRRDEAQVELGARIFRDGVVLTDSITATGSSDPQFKGAAMAAVRLWRYRPGRLGGCPVNVYMTVRVSFDAE